MSTPNFYNQNNFKLYVQSFEPMTIEEFLENEFEFFDEDNYLKYLELDNGEYKSYLLKKSYESAIEFYNQLFYENIFKGYDGFRDLMEDFNSNLIFHELELVSGHYVGVQIYIEEKENPNKLNNDDCNYYFDMCRSKSIKKYESEINKINKWLDKVASKHGWRELHCLGVFSNGEAVYEYA